MKFHHFTFCVITFALLFMGHQGAYGVTPAEFRHCSTIHSIGMEWDHSR